VQELGATRSVSKSTHLLQTPDTFVRIKLPGIGARFTQYTAEMESGGTIAPSPVQRFLYVANGSVTVTISGASRKLGPNGFAYLPPGSIAIITSPAESRIEIIEKPYLALPDYPTPEPLFGSESEVTSTPLMGDPALQVRSLLPDSLPFDFAVNTMEYRPGAALAMVEMHVMEHGLLMLQGGGIYRLADDWYPVAAGDFIWMAPYCPQWFGALGKQPAKYLIYKDWNRSPLA
jgi:(S)-ureidoglycine aminohydrolase